MRDDDSGRFDSRKQMAYSPSPAHPTDVLTPPMGSRNSWVKQLQRTQSQLDMEKVDKETYVSDMRGFERQLKDARGALEKKADDTIVTHLDQKIEEVKKIVLSVNKKFNERQCSQLGRFETMERMHVEAKKERERILGKLEKALSFRVVGLVGLIVTIAATGFGYARSFGKVEEAQRNAEITDKQTKDALESMSTEVTELKIAVQNDQKKRTSLVDGDGEEIKKIAKEVLRQYDKEKRSKKRRRE